MSEPTLPDLAYEIDGRRVPPDLFYAVACDPRRSVSVEACAGAGKTWMLVSRILRALLDGAQPHEVLAITFTRKAAGEMRQRLQDWLEAFAQKDVAALAGELRLRGVPAHEAEALASPLQQLHARLLTGGRPVQIRTFHGWFAALLRNAPLATLEELGLPARHTLLEDDTEAVDKVWRRFHAVVAADPAARRDYEEAVAAHGRFQTLKGLRAALSKRVEFTLADRAGVVEGSVQPFTALFPEFAGLDRPEQSLGGDGARARWMARARLLGAQENKTPRKAADAVVDAFACDDLQQRVALLRKAFFVASEDRLTANLTKFEPAQDAEAELQRLCRAAAQHDAWLHHHRLARLSRVLVAQFAALKREEGWVDMTDVEQAAHRLLSDPVLSGWIQERLDARVRHLLVDEFQDTNPLQWQALHGWLSGYAGAGGTPPSVFIVGDPKQSIYRFRRAEPQVFMAAQRFVAEGLGGARLSCDHTRRNAPEVLAAVNLVMGQAQAAGQYQDFRPHSTGSHEAGRLLRLPAIARPSSADRAPAAPAAEDWRDSLVQPRELPEEHLVTLECRQAARWIASRLAGGLAPQDILVLARKRDRLAVLEDELRLLRIPAQQPEKTNLAEASEVQDLVALLDALVSPSHDLSLARALKSPVFGVDDAALVAIAQLARRRRAEGTPRSWLDLLVAGEELDEALAAIGQQLARWRQLARKLPPHDALDAICQQGDVLARYAASVPPALREAALANLRALPGAALQLDGGRYATPYAFVRAMRARGVPGPAVGQAAAVRLLTVHGAKGLEAPVVLLLDTDAAAPKPETMGVLVDWPGERAAPRRYSFLASETRPPGCHTTAMAEEFAAREREELNALYVAMTRAQRELVISSVQPRTASAAPSWWQRLEPSCAAVEAPAEVAPPQPPSLPAILLPAIPAAPARARAPSPVREQRSPAGRFGELVHRLLELHGAGEQPADAALLRLGLGFGVPPAEHGAARAMARRIATGEGAWLWDAAEVEWQGDEVELTDAGEVVRLDRLVRRRDGTWWVVDYKSAARPDRDAALQAQLRRYAALVARLHPGTLVRAAFLSGEGRLLPLD